jgi:dTDP-4-amino-4,6-dideoxygalactose transaminase
MVIPFSDLYKLHEKYEKEFTHAFSEMVKTSSFIGGKHVKEFEKDFADYVGLDHCISCANGSDALIIALRALDLPKDSLVMVPAMSYAASAMCISNTGNVPVFVDVNPSTGLIDIESMKTKWYQGVKVLILVHLYGQQIPEEDMANIISFAKDKNMYIIEDCAQAVGVRTNSGKHIGYQSSISTYSFYPGKNLGALGDGGCVTTACPKLAYSCRLIANLGSREKYCHEVVGINSRLDSIQAIFLKIKLRDIEEHGEYRRKIARLYDQLLSSRVTVPKRDNTRDTYHVYYIFVSNEKRDHLKNHLKTVGIEANIHYPIPMNRLECFNHIGARDECPVAEQFGNTCLSLPMFPGITEEEVRYVAENIIEFFQGSQLQH